MIEVREQDNSLYMSSARHRFQGTDFAPRNSSLSILALSIKPITRDIAGPLEGSSWPLSLADIAATAGGRGRNASGKDLWEGPSGVRAAHSRTLDVGSSEGHIHLVGEDATISSPPSGTSESGLMTAACSLDDAACSVATSGCSALVETTASMVCVAQQVGGLGGLSGGGLILGSDGDRGARAETSRAVPSMDMALALEGPRSKPKPLSVVETGKEEEEAQEEAPGGGGVDARSSTRRSVDETLVDGKGPGDPPINLGSSLGAGPAPSAESTPATGGRSAPELSLARMRCLSPIPKTPDPGSAS